jgi:hypothetical protein
VQTARFFIPRLRRCRLIALAMRNYKGAHSACLSGGQVNAMDCVETAGGGGLPALPSLFRLSSGIGISDWKRGRRKRTCRKTFPDWKISHFKGDAPLVCCGISTIEDSVDERAIKHC